MNGRWVMMASESCLRCVPPELERRRRRNDVRPVKTVLVTGGAGYIGASLVRGLLADGLHVRVLDALWKGDAAIRALYTNADFELVRGDVRRVEPVVRAIQGVDAVIHLAAACGPEDYRRDPRGAIETNVAATGMLAEICRGMGVTRLILASTLDIYGRRSREVDESSEPEPRSLFAASKLDAERLALSAGDGSLSAVAFRLGDVFGSDACAAFDSGVNRLARLAWRRGGIGPSWGARPVYRTHVGDVCAVLRQALVCRAEVIAGQAFNVGAEEMRHTGEEVAALLAELAPELAPPGAVRPALPAPVVSFQKLRNRFGWPCRRTLQQGLAELVWRLRRGEAIVTPPPGSAPSWPAAELAAARFKRSVRPLVEVRQ